GGTAELAVGGGLQAGLALHGDRPGDRLVLGGPQLGRVDAAGREVIPGGEQLRRAEQAADVVGAERRCAAHTGHRGAARPRASMSAWPMAGERGAVVWGASGTPWEDSERLQPG